MLVIFRQFGAEALSVIHVVLAICVTAHVLLHKRDVGASIGWIGLAWLSPILGSILYVMFGINRVKRRANQVRELEDTPSVRGMIRKVGHLVEVVD